MQNIDFYERKNTRVMQPQYDTFDSEFLPRMAQNTPREIERVRKKASRIFFLVTSLCIISFTVGIVIGIKFSGGTKREIMDKKTFNAVTDFSRKLSLLPEEKAAEPATRENPFPRDTYPYVIRVNDEHDYATSQKIAGLLSQRGHTVILSKNNDRYRIYIGPYKNGADAREALEKISGYNKYSLAEKTRIIKR